MIMILRILETFPLLQRKTKSYVKSILTFLPISKFVFEDKLKNGFPPLERERSFISLQEALPLIETCIFVFFGKIWSPTFKPAWAIFLELEVLLDYHLEQASPISVEIYRLNF